MSYYQILCALFIFLFSSYCDAENSQLPSLVSDVRNNQHLTFFHTSANLDLKDSVWHIPIHGWIYEPQDSVVRKAIVSTVLTASYGLKTTQATQSNFDQRVNLLFADNEAGNQIVIRIAGQDISLPVSLSNGHFYANIKLSIAKAKQYSSKGLLGFRALLTSSDIRQFQGQVKLIQPMGISVISDIDDTVKISHVIDHKRLFDYTFFKDFIAVPGMSDWYRKWSSREISFHFVSSSPWHLYVPLMEFIQTEKFPWATFSLKMIRLKDKSIMNIFKKGTQTKPQQIEPILKRYPERQFILVGDSGEQDPEVYAAIIRKYPKQIIKILIRNVTQSSASDSRFKKTFKGIDANKWQLFTKPNVLRLPLP